MKFSVLFLALALPGLAHADQALIVGVDRYPGLPKDSYLEGCVNDAKAIEAKLTKLGFKTTVLINGQATRTGILGALSKLRSSNKASEKFVFFFAGHGDRNIDRTNTVLLPYDATTEEDSPEIGRDELAKAVLAVPASSRSIMLDSCFSGGMLAASRDVNNKFKARFFSRSQYRKVQSGSRDLDEVTTNPGDDIDIVSGGKNICYFTASKANEVANEDDFEGKRHGLFTYFLLDQIEKTDRQWKSLQADVAVGVLDRSEDLQHPSLSPQFESKKIFEVSEAPPKPPRNIWEQYAQDVIDSSKLESFVVPGKTQFHVGELLRFGVRAKADGYLIVMNRGTSGKLYLRFPANRTVEAAKVAAGSVYNLPSDENKSFTPNAPGTERIKAILFKNASDAEAVLKAFGDKSNISTEQSRDLEIAELSIQGFWTSSVIIEILPAKPAELSGFWASLGAPRALLQTKPSLKLGNFSALSGTRTNPIASGFRSGMERYLKEKCQDEIEVLGAATAEKPSHSFFSLDAELEEFPSLMLREKAYLCRAFLSYEGQGKRLVGTIIGKADSFRELSRGFGNGENTHLDGLLGKVADNVRAMIHEFESSPLTLELIELSWLPKLSIGQLTGVSGAINVRPDGTVPLRTEQAKFVYRGSASTQLVGVQLSGQGQALATTLLRPQSGVVMIPPLDERARNLLVLELTDTSPWPESGPFKQSQPFAAKFDCVAWRLPLQPHQEVLVNLVQRALHDRSQAKWASFRISAS